MVMHTLIYNYGKTRKIICKYNINDWFNFIERTINTQRV